jgi:lactoylglutathione lyase
MGVQRFSHVGICVSDVERSLHFYRDLLGFREQYGFDVVPEYGGLMELDGVVGRSLFLERDGVRIELLTYEHPPATGTGERRPMNALGVSHFGIRVSNLVELVEELRAEGVNVLDRTRLTIEDPDGGPNREWVFVTDPDGVRVELIQLPDDYRPADAEP